MRIQVEKDIPYNPSYPNRCVGGSDYEGTEVCKYHVTRNSYHGKKAPAELNKPKCTLFDDWLSDSYNRCEACKKACEKALEVGNNG